MVVAVTEEPHEEPGWKDEFVDATQLQGLSFGPIGMILNLKPES